MAGGGGGQQGGGELIAYSTQQNLSALHFPTPFVAGQPDKAVKVGTYFNQEGVSGGKGQLNFHPTCLQ